MTDKKIHKVDYFTLKGGTAINLFTRDMPYLDNRTF